MIARRLRRKIVLSQIRRREPSLHLIARSRIGQSRQRATIACQLRSRIIALPSRLATTARRRPLQTSALNHGRQRKPGRPRNSSVHNQSRLLRIKSVRTSRKSRSNVAVSQPMAPKSFGRPSFLVGDFAQLKIQDIGVNLALRKPAHLFRDRGSRAQRQAQRKRINRFARDSVTPCLRGENAGITRARSATRYSLVK